MDNHLSKWEQELAESRQLWNAEASSFDKEADHGLHDPHVRAAWTRLLRASFPTNNLNILDIGCGTGSISVVLAELGHMVTGIDLSPAMIAQAEAKAGAVNHTIRFHVMDAAFPQLAPQQFDAIVCRHLLWTLPEIDQVLQRWLRLLRPGGRLLLIEGFWYMNAGLHAQQILDALPEPVIHVSVETLSDQVDLWGRVVNDERYAILADLSSKEQ
jgi:ubiquinone/menaquinone biosynthesis C-methylase UbiE